MKYSNKPVALPVIDGLSGNFYYKYVDLLMQKTSNYSRHQIASTMDAADFLRKYVYDSNVNTYEQFYAIYLSRNNEILGVHNVSKGGTSATVVDPKLVSSAAVKVLASGVILTHNHPSGRTEPSDADKEITQKLQNGLKLLDINILDHIIISEESYYSFAEHGAISDLKGISEINFLETNTNINPMISKNNYYSEIERIGLKNLPLPMQEMHELINDLTKNGSNWGDYDADPDIQEYCKVQFDKLQEIIDKTKNEEHKPAKPVKPEKIKTGKGEDHLVSKLKKVGIDKMSNDELLELANTITFYDRQDNDEGEITDINEAKKVIIDQYSDYAAAASSSTGIKHKRKSKKKKELYKVGDNLYWTDNDGTKMTETIVKVSHNENGDPVYSVKVSPVREGVRSYDYDQKDLLEKIKKGYIFLNKQPIDATESLSWPVRIAKRFAAMHGKTFDKAAVGRFIKFIQKPIITKDLRKTDSHSDVVMEIQEFLVKIFNSMSGPVKIEIDSVKLEKFKTLGHSQKVMPAVSYIKRFLNMYPSPTKEAAAKLRIEILNAIESKAITETNPYAEEIRAIVKALEKVKDGGDLKISQADLKGLQGICSLCLPKKKSIGKVSESENERIQNLFEIDLLNQGWFKRLTGIKEFVYNKNYNIDSDPDKVWIEVFEIPELTFKAIDNDYNAFVKSFKKWAKEHGLIGPEIMTDEESGSMSFVVSKSTGVNGLGNPFVTSLVTNVLANTLTDTIKKTSVKSDTGGPISADRLSMMKFKTIGLKGKYGQVIGDPEVGFSAIIFGPPKNGKSTFAIDFARHLAENNGKTLYCAIEEGYGYTLQDKIKRLGATHSRLSFSDRLMETYSGYDFVFIDSTNKAGLSNDDCERIKANNPETSFIFIMQSTKDGKFRGDQTFAHDQDIIIEVENGIAHVMGRFAPPAEMKIFEKLEQNV